MFHDKLYELRKQHQLSQEELAQKLNVSKQSISKWESGSVTPNLDKLMLVSKLFDVSLNDLLKPETQQKTARKDWFLMILSGGAFFLLILCFLLHAYHPAESFTSAFSFDIYILFAILSFITLMISLFLILMKHKK